MPSNPPAPPDHKRAELRRAALKYHEFPTPGKIATAPTKHRVTQHAPPLPCSPGRAAPDGGCRVDAGVRVHR